MANIEVIYTIKNKSIREKVNRDLQWYDNLKQEMQYFKGGQLVLKYKFDKYLDTLSEKERIKIGYKTPYRLLPEVTDLNVMAFKSESNKDKILKFFTDYLNYNNSDISIISEDETSMNFDVPEKEIDDFSYQLDRNNFKYL